MALAELRLSQAQDWTACRVRISPRVGQDHLDFGDELFTKLCETDTPWNCILALDEIRRYSNLHERGIFSRLILEARHIGVRTIFGCQRMSIVPISIQSELTDFIIFQQTRPRDVETIAKWTSDEIAEKARILPKRECIYVQF